MHNLSAGPAWPTYQPEEHQQHQHVEQQQQQQQHQQQAQYHGEDSADFKSQYQYQPVYQQSFPIGLQQQVELPYPYKVNTTNSRQQPIVYPQPPDNNRMHHNLPVTRQKHANQPPTPPPLPTTFNNNSNGRANSMSSGHTNFGSWRRGSTGMTNNNLRGFNSTQTLNTNPVWMKTIALSEFYFIRWFESVHDLTVWYDMYVWQ